MERRQIEQLADQNSLRAIDYSLAVTMAKRGGETDASVILAAALASRASADGHICLDLKAIAGGVWPPAAEGNNRTGLLTLTLPPLNDWLVRLRASPICDVIDDGGNHRKRPFVLTHNRLYMRRFYKSEQQIAHTLIALAGPAEEIAIRDADRRRIDTVFRGDAPADDLPRQAAVIAWTRRLLILSGGPGTGKTFTLARLLDLLLQKARSENRQPVIRLAAPTGKAAMRMRESIQHAKQSPVHRNAIGADIPEEACTLHRLLGSSHQTATFRYHTRNPLPADIVIVDEASMIALPMMAALLSALKPGAQLILLGDMNQLSSVEPGYILGDICAAAQSSPASPLGRTLVELKHSWRFTPDGPVGRLSAALQDAGSDADVDGEKAWRLAIRLSAPDHPDKDTPGIDRLTLHDAPDRLRHPDGHPLDDLSATILQGYGPLMDAGSVTDAFAALGQFRILCALRRGPYGVEAVNKLTEDILSQRFGSLPGRPRPRMLNPSGRFYDHRVIMITCNHYDLGLFNGDVGILLPTDADQPPADRSPATALAAWFETSDGNARGFRTVPCDMLPAHETAFAMTIHKAQGSQFRNALIMLPPVPTPVLTKELIYTGITRVIRNVTLWCNPAEFKAAAVRRTERLSGLTAALLR